MSSRRFNRLDELAVAALALALGIDRFSLRSRGALAISLCLLLLSVVVLVHAVAYLAAPGGFLHRARHSIALATGSTLVSLVAAAVASIVINMGHTRAFLAQMGGTQGEKSSMRDAELGWAPLAADKVGQRLMAIDHGREQILVVGDSITYGWGIPDGHVWNDFLAPMEPNFQVLNAGVSGYSIDQYLLYLRRIVPKMKPRHIVVVVFSGNDYQVSGLQYSWGSSKPLLDIVDGKLENVGKAGACIDGLATSLLFRYLWADTHRARDLIELICRPPRLEGAHLEAVLSRTFDEIERLGREHGARVGFAISPTRRLLQFGDADGVLYLNHYRDLRRILVAGGHTLVDFFPETGEGGDTAEQLYIDGGHFTERGQHHLADAIKRFVDGDGAPSQGGGHR